MCGISGYVDMQNGIKTSLLKEMTDIIRHRGPDDEGFALIHENGEIQFAAGKDTISDMRSKQTEITEIREGESFFLGIGHRRLSILDLSSNGHQPMKKHNCILTFNGEIYNYIEIREELKNSGYDFCTKCDTEVILAAYDRWGIECINRFNGMWGFALYDIKKQKLFLCRDRFGVKPLYYFKTNNKLLFGSEIKQILCDREIARVANLDVLKASLVYQVYDYSQKTCFRDINSLPGGCYAEVDFDFRKHCISNFQVTRYYNLSKKIGTNEKDTGIQEELTEAVKLRMRSDVKVGSCLSGGLDSSSIVGIACSLIKQSGGDVVGFTTVTSGFAEHPEVDETQYSKSVVEYCGCEENIVRPDANQLMKLLEKIVWHQDEPCPHLGILTSYSVFHKAAELECKVVYDGQGGDEGLAGYHSYYEYYLLYILKNKGLKAFIRQLKTVARSSEKRMMYLMAMVTYYNFTGVRKFYIRKSREKYLSSQLRKVAVGGTVNSLLAPRYGNDIQILDFTRGTLQGILHWEDRNSMASSLETRLPFLDYLYVEKVLNIDMLDKISNGYTKMPLRRAVDDILPQNVVWRKSKLGFPSPTKAWLYQMPQEYVLDLLQNAKSREVFNLQKVKKQYLSGKGDTRMVERFILTELWMREFDVKIE